MAQLTQLSWTNGTVWAFGLLGAIASFAVARPEDPAPSAESSPLAVELYAAGLTPEVMACAGFTAVQTSSAVSRTRAEFGVLFNQIQFARLALQEASSQRERLSAVVRSGTGTPEQSVALVAIAREEREARSALASAVAAVRDVAVEGLPSTLVAGLDRIESNARNDLPAWHRAAEREEQEWLAIRDSLVSERIHVGHGQQVPARAQAILAAAAADPDVAMAKSNFDINGSAVSVAWLDAIWR